MHFVMKFLKTKMAGTHGTQYVNEVQEFASVQTSMWLTTCAMRRSLREYSAGHLGHLYGFSPLWTRWWRRRSELVRKPLSHV